MHPAQPVAGHPCVCRERLWLTGANIGCDGASLRVRGVELTSLLAVPGWRIIPACAGRGSGPSGFQLRVIPACAGNGLAAG